MKEKLLDELDRCGINERMIYPDLSGLCRHINKLYEMPLTDNTVVRNPPRDPKKLVLMPVSVKVTNSHQGFGGTNIASGHSESIRELNRQEVSDGFQQYRHTYTRDFDFD